MTTSKHSRRYALVGVLRKVVYALHIGNESRLPAIAGMPDCQCAYAKLT
jgi:hypothetical protein